MEITPSKIFEFTQYAMRNPNATQQDFFVNGYGPILVFLCDSDPERAKAWSRYLMETLERNRHPLYSLSTFLGFVFKREGSRIANPEMPTSNSRSG